MEIKVEKIEWHRMNGKNYSLTARTYGVDRKRIREWEKAYDKLLQAVGRQRRRLRGSYIHEGLLVNMLLHFSGHRIIESLWQGCDEPGAT